MARALASDPTVLVLIDPTAGVDVRSKETLLDAVEGARAERAGVLIVSDELDDLRTCDRVARDVPRAGSPRRTTGAGPTTSWSPRWRVSPMTEIAEPPIVVAEAPPHRRTFDRVSRPRPRTSRWSRRSSCCSSSAASSTRSSSPGDNIINVLQQQSEISLLVLAETLILIVGRIDLSLESTVGLAPALAVLIVTDVLRPGTARMDGDPDLPAGRSRRRLAQRPADREVQAERVHRHARAC